MDAGNQKSQSVRYGTLLDNRSTDDFLTHTAANRIGLTGRPINLITEGFGGKKSRVPDEKMYDISQEIQWGFRSNIFLWCE